MAVKWDLPVTGSNLAMVIEEDDGETRYPSNSQYSTVTASQSRWRHGSASVRTMQVIEVPMLIDDETGMPTGHTEMHNDDFVNLASAYFIYFCDRFVLRIANTMLPFLLLKVVVKEKNIGTRTGLLFSVFSVAEIFSNLYTGAISDEYGRRIGTFVAIGGICGGYLFTALADQFWTLLIARFICGFFVSCEPVTLAIVNDMFDVYQVTKYMSYASIVSAAASLMGPPLSSGLAQFNIRLPFYVCSAVGLIALVYAYLMLEETHPDVLDQMAKKEEELTGLEVKSMSEEDLTGRDAGLSAIDETKPSEKDGLTDGDPNEESTEMVWQVYFCAVVFFLDGFAYQVNDTMLAIFMEQKFGIGSSQFGYYALLFRIGNIFMVVFGFPISVWLIRVYPTLALGFLFESLGYALIGFSRKQLYLALAGAVLMYMGAGLLLSSTKSALAPFLTPRTAGKAMALCGATSAIGFVIAPVISGAAFEWDASLPFVMASLLTMFACLTVTIFKMLGFHHGMNFSGKEVGIRMSTDTAKSESLKKPAEEPSNTADGDSSMNMAQSMLYQPVQDDYLRLGTWFGTLLNERNYEWVHNFAKLQRSLDRMFPMRRATLHPSSAVHPPRTTAVSYMMSSRTTLLPELQSARQRRRTVRAKNVRLRTNTTMSKRASPAPMVTRALLRGARGLSVSIAPPPAPPEPGRLKDSV